MTAARHPDIETAIRYHRAVAAFAAGDELAAFFHPDATHHEYPNALFPDGNIRTVKEMCAAAEAGRHTLREQSFEVLNAVAMDGQVAVEVLWTGVTAVPLGGIPAGSTLRAHIAAFLEFRDGLILAQRNYDCYERIPVDMNS